jgi:hypothetical protein
MEKTTNQIDYVPRKIKTVPGAIQTTWYPSARPLQHYRKTGTSGSHTAAISYSTPNDCTPCLHSRRVGKSFKMLGKKDDGMQKVVCCQPGNAISFSGTANIHTGSTNKPRINVKGEENPEYYFDYSTYLKRRGNTYVAKSTFHAIEGIDYTKAPDGSANDSSHYAQNLPTSPACANRTIYKPSNRSFSTQGPVDGSTHTARKKYNAITTNNASFIKPWGVKMMYTEDPLFFQKNKVTVCSMAH